MKKLIALLALAGGAVATFIWLRTGGDLGQMEGAAQHAIRKTEDEIAALDGRDEPYAPAQAASA